MLLQMVFSMLPVCQTRVKGKLFADTVQRDPHDRQAVITAAPALKRAAALGGPYTTRMNEWLRSLPLTNTAAILQRDELIAQAEAERAIIEPKLATMKNLLSFIAG